MECLQKDFRRGLCRLFRSWKIQIARPLSLTLEKNTARPGRWSKRVSPNGRKVPVPKLNRNALSVRSKGPKDHIEKKGRGGLMIDPQDVTTEVISKENRDDLPAMFHKVMQAGSQGRP